MTDSFDRYPGDDALGRAPRRNDLRSRLDSWLRGELAPEEAAAFLRAAAAEPALASEVAAYEELLAGIRALPESVPPEVDLWPGISARVRASRARDSRRRLPRAAVALAASLVVAVLALVAWQARRDPPSEARLPAESPVAPVEAGGVALAAYAATDETLGAICDELRRAIEARQEKLPPETRALVFENLRTIDRALAEIEAALAAAPADPELSRTYITYRQREIDLLRQANRMAARL
jgi:hypothetical protein